jgi:two-component system, NtrC family, sensor kinase
MDLDDQSRYLLKAVDTLNGEVVVISKDFRILAANNTVVNKRGKNLVGRQCHDVFFDLPNPCDNCSAEKIVTQGDSPLSFGLWTDDRDFKRLSCHPIFDGESIEALLLTDLDITKFKWLKDELHRTNAFFRNMIGSAVDGVIAADRTGKILIFNDAAGEITGFSVEEGLNHDIRDLYPEGGAKEVMQRLRSDDFGGKGKLKSFQFEMLRKDGETVPISLNAAIVYEENKEVASIGFFHDLREEFKMKKKLEKTQLQLLQAEKMSSLGELAAGVAHQLNNPLGGIILFTKLVLEEHDLEEAARDDLNRILADAQRCRDTVKELLEFARQGSQFMKAIDINTSLSRIMFLIEKQTLFQNIEIAWDLQEHLPPAHADMQQLNHMFMNIIINAAQAMEGKGKLGFKTYLSFSGKHIIIEIFDTGPGIPEEILKQIFEPFFTTKEEGKGTGLGLSMVYSIVENHGGKISVNSKVGEGTTFAIKLPVAKNIEGDESGKND